MMKASRMKMEDCAAPSVVRRDSATERRNISAGIVSPEASSSVKKEKEENAGMFGGIHDC